MENKRGQVTIFIIIAVMIVVLGILIYVFYPNLKSVISTQTENPSSFMQSCIEEKLNENAELISKQGGSLEPEHYYLYNNQKIEYLCYTEENYKTCVVQKPMLKNSIEEEIENSISSRISNCFNDLKQNYENKGYDIEIKKGEMNIDLIPQKIVLNLNSSISLTKDENKKYDSIRVVINNNLYELIGIANSIINWESSYGDAETTTYMNYYRDLKIEKKKQSDGTTIYILTERDTGNKFQFASRSIPWPPGFG